jgi:hypothetical protein
MIEDARAKAIADLEQSRASLSERCLQLEALLQLVQTTPELVYHSFLTTIAG